MIEIFYLSVYSFLIILSYKMQNLREALKTCEKKQVVANGPKRKKDGKRKYERKD